MKKHEKHEEKSVKFVDKKLPAREREFADYAVDFSFLAL